MSNIATSNLSKSEQNIWKNFTWKRPEEWMSEEPKLFGTGISPDNIIEGYLGNSYFVSTLKAMAENPENIRRLFDTKKAAEEGQYFVNVCLNGENFTVEVDDYIPYCEKTCKPAFIRSNNGIWPLILEKAWAKI